jgi:hypothetical protein
MRFKWKCRHDTCTGVSSINRRYEHCVLTSSFVIFDSLLRLRVLPPWRRIILAEHDGIVNLAGALAHQREINPAVG